MLIPKQIRRPKHLLFTITMVVLATVGAIATVTTYTSIYAHDALDIKEHANTFAHVIDASLVQQMSGSSQDLGTQAYETEKKRLMVLRAENPNIRFVYLISTRATSAPLILADSEHPSSPDYSPPGQVYGEAPPQLIQTLNDGIPRTAVYTDRWGHWMSAFAPVRDDSGATIAILGVDTLQQDMIVNAMSHAAVPALSILVLIVILIAFQVVRTQELEYIEKKAEFLSLASHEIRSPLTGIRWAIEGVFEDSGHQLSEESLKTLQAIYDNCNTLLSRVNNILDVAMLEQSKNPTLEPIELRHYLEEILSGLQLSAKQRNITLTVDPSIDDKLVVVFDNQLMRHVFFNLLANAIKYTTDGTAVTVSYVSDGKYNVFKITDQGKGISAEDQKRIFYGYQRAKEDPSVAHKEGTGLGLFLVKRVTELHKGTVSIESEPDKGTTFVIKLPA